MNEFMDMMKPQIDELNRIQKTAYEEGYNAGKRFAFRYMRQVINEISILTVEQEKELDKMVENDIRFEREMREEKEIKECKECNDDKSE